MIVSANLQERCAGILYLVLDVDGVMTSGDITYADNGHELKTFYVRDGSGLKMWHQAGKRSAIITGRSSPVVQTRASELGIERVIQGAGDKFSAYRRLLADWQADPRQVCAVGDDLPDLPVLRNSGLAVAVADGCMEARGIAQMVTRAAGGQGAVREVIEMILRVQGHWQETIKRYLAEQL